MLNLNDIKNKALQGDLNGALEALLSWVKLNKQEFIAEVESYLSNLNHNIRENARGKLTTEQFSSAKAKILEGFQLLIYLLQGKNTIGNSRFQTYHSFTCNRSEQMKSFESSYRQQLLKKAQFYYIYGLDLHSHQGIFNRISYHLEGLLWDYLDPLFKKKKDAIRVIVPSIDVNNNLTIYKENLLKKLFRSFSIDPNTIANILDTSLSFLLNKSPQTKRLKNDDFICVFLGITDRDWDKENTPTIVRWFINEFCEDITSEESPNLLFFFGIIYEEPDSSVKKEVKEVVNNSKLVEALPELGMVTTNHLKDWFDEYGKFFPRVRERKKIIQQALNNLEEYKENDSYFMDDIQDELEKIIDKINEDLIKKNKSII